MKLRRSFALLVLLVPALTAWAGTLVPEPDRIDDRAAKIALAEIAVRAGRFAEAARAYDQLLASETAPSAALLLAAGNARLYAGDVAGALPFYQRAAKVSPADPAARRALALALAWTGRTAEARPLLETLAVESPTDEEIARALVAVSAGDPGGADRGIVVLRQRVAREPGNTTAKADLADLLAMRGHAAEARALYDAARAQVSPKPGDAFDLRHARARLTWGDFYPAEAAFRAALAVTPGDAALRGDLLALLISMDRLERAEALALTWLDEQPDSPVALNRQIEIQRKRHDDAAVAALLAKHPEPLRTPPAPGSPSARFAAAGREAVREEAFVGALTGPADGVVPETAPRLVEWSGLYAGQGDFELAIRCLRAARRADPQYFPAWIGLAEFLAIAQHYDEAHRQFAALAVAFPENRQVLLKQARALGWGRRYDDSLLAYEHLRSLNPEDPVPLLEQARVAGWAKQRDQADRLYALRWEGREIDARLFAGLAPLLPDWGKRSEDRKESAHEEPFHYTERFEAELPALIAAAAPETAAKLQKLRL
ncbi:MAG: tetratricopeptide repeat protein, partial [Burkholderiales bacterium]|nr:tetratricopeptide repeat protein [Opitutaceae bacterium]